MPYIWLVEDDGDIREITLYALRAADFRAEGFGGGADFFAALEGEGKPDLVILDIMLPGEDGLAILKRLRSDRRYRELPVVMLTAKGREYDKVKGLDLGADDYITKPHGVMELISRINALLRRSKPPAQKDLTYRGIHIDPDRRSASVNGTTVTLTYKEYELLHYMMRNAEIVLPRDRILEAVWGYDFEGESRTLDVHIKSLRQKLGGASVWVKTVRNVGYKLGE
ncbi:MAG: response regulator transcription factor [Defluviitaleaceae bacterium]|nr:response regulator transcription factor [Defluviitaleaceae bacterium]